MDYANILQKTWETIWKHKILWLFGFLAGCSGSGGGGMRYSSNWRSFPNRPLPDFLQNFQHLFNQLSEAQIAGLIVLGVCLGVFFMLLSLVLSSIGQAGLIRGTLMGQESAEPITLNAVWQAAQPFILRLIGIILVMAAIIFLVIIILGFLVVLGSVFTLGVGLVCLIPLFCLLLPLFWLVGIYIQQVNVALVTEDLDIPSAFRRAWEVVSTHWPEYLVMGLILGIGGAVALLIIALPMLFTVMPAIWGIAVGRTSGILAAGVLFLLYSPILMVATGIIHAFIGSAWTLTYRELNTLAPPPELAAEIAAE